MNASERPNRPFKLVLASSSATFGNGTVLDRTLRLPDYSLGGIRKGGLAAFIALGCPGLAKADLVVSSAATVNVQCGHGVCAATAPDAVLNVDKLTGMLNSGNVKVTTAQPSEPNIVIAAPISRTSSYTLTLDAYTSISIEANLSVTGAGGLSAITNDGGARGTFSVSGGANVSFWSTDNQLSIARNRYTLVSSVTMLAAAANAKPTGYFALISDYDASLDGRYATAPVKLLEGSFQGLGHTISNLSINGTTGNSFGLFEYTSASSVLHDLTLQGVSITTHRAASVGGLSGVASGTMSNIGVSGAVMAPGKEGSAGLLAGQFYEGTILNTHSDGTVNSRFAGGLIGIVADNGLGAAYIVNSSSTARIISPKSQVYAAAGGLVG